ncbi:MAG: gliding motility-associated-like protein, partial [Saprospiraceae bacterium]
EPPEINLNLGDDQFLTLGDTAIIEANVNFLSQFIDTIIWSPADIINCGDSTCMEIGFMTFNTVQVFATVIDINGCTDDDEVIINMRKSRDVFIPNVFSPNDDGYNDHFTIFTNDQQIQNIPSFKVFNRWGELMFDATNFEANVLSNGWDGYFKGERMNPGVFIYLAEIEFIDGRVELYKGDVTLVR